MKNQFSQGQSLQEKYAPKSLCFGCGPANPKGLRIRSIAPASAAFSSLETPATIGVVTAEFTPEEHHEAFPGVLNGGIIGALLDCHSNWTAAFALMLKGGESQPQCTVTADFHVKLLRPTPMSGGVELKAWVAEFHAERAVIEAELWAGGKKCATCRGTFVQVKPGHPAYHRW